MNADARPIVVLAAVIERDGRFLVARRLTGTHLSGFWEFPGGKCEAGETHEACLARELEEELAVVAQIGDELLVTEHAYPDRMVRLHFRRCRIGGEPRPLLGQEIRWATRSDLRLLQFPEGDRDLIDLLSKTPGN
jgi:8-oxo-dGTP diphosphatase